MRIHHLATIGIIGLLAVLAVGCSRSSPTLTSAVIRRVKSYSARAINTRRVRRGPVWQHGFHDHAVRHEESLRRVAQYVVENPLRSGLVTTVRAYPLWDAIWI